MDNVHNVYKTNDKKDLLIQNLKILRQQELNNKQPFKAKAYIKVIQSLETHVGSVITVDDLDGIDGVGDRIKQKLIEILDKGFIERTKESLKDTDKTKAAEVFTTVMSIGNVKAKQLVDLGILTIDVLKERVKENPTLLNDKQKLGLCYHDDFIKRIPRAEMTKHDAFIKSVVNGINPKLVCEIVGSYRRGAANSGDIDVLLTHPNSDDHSWFSQIVSALKESYLVDDFAYGTEKYMGIGKLHRHKTYRRVDLLYIPSTQFPFALLYFTGSQDFNIEMRNAALEKGYSLSEHGFKYSTGPNKGEFIPHKFNTEKDIFTFLDIEYVEPANRARGAIKRI